MSFYDRPAETINHPQHYGGGTTCVVTDVSEREKPKKYNLAGGTYMTRPEILEEARKCVCGDREQDYGTPENSFAAIAELWEPYIKRKCVSLGADVCIEPEDVGLMMALFKVARLETGTAKPDSFIDAAGYIACAAEIATQRPETAALKGE